MAHRIPMFALLAGCCLLAAAPVTSAHAKEPSVETEPGKGEPEITAAPVAAIAPIPFEETMTGDWGGLRTRLKGSGISLRADYVSETFSAVDGGVRRGTAYTQQIRAGMDFDMGKIAGWSGAIFHVTLNDRRGVGISADYVGNRLPIQEAYGGQYVRLGEVSYEQNLLDSKLNLRLGYFAMGNDLGGMALGCNFVNAAFCAHPLSLSGDSGWYNYPNARWGAAIRYRPRADIALRTGIYQVNPDLGNEGNAFHPFAGGSTGVILPFEVEYDPGLRTDSRVLPGHYKVGVYYDTSRAARLGGGEKVTARYGVYILADQMILREGSGGRGLSLFGQFTANPEASAQITRWYAAGVVKTGTLRGRDADTLALGIVHAQFDPRLRRAHAETAGILEGYAALPAGETAIEMSYGFQARRWLSIRPDVQYIIEPGSFAFRSTRNALALGCQVRMQF
ncbi:carbohydrate porin [Novosphingobium sp. P6W]|uniref:carbohydrate porin n=1 Tax=Novosphingobium sp. P6W TaxID=1609758 RepID=UPI0005C2CEA2|nr:carbohydrate porin [Novosphingobium sp. P6W]AXB79738.1 carbohydrate porin [Novosphingobium sp. P6W]KIS34448.1 porin [Novosphingobium sp. P6W]